MQASRNQMSLRNSRYNRTSGTLDLNRSDTWAAHNNRPFPRQVLLSSPVLFSWTERQTPTRDPTIADQTDRLLAQLVGPSANRTISLSRTRQSQLQRRNAGLNSAQ